MPNDRRADVHLTGDLSSCDAAARPVDDAVFRIAVLGDFSGRAHRSAPAPASAQRIRRVDRDDLDDAIAAFAPRIEIALESGQPSIVVTAFRLDDFHPDRLIERVSMLRDLRAMREQGASSPPSSSREPPRRAEPKTDAVVRELSGGSLLDRIVDNNEASTPGGALLGTAPRDELSRFVEQAVRKHVVPDAPAEQRDVAAKIDAVIAATLRVLLHHPDVQSVESLWRAVDLLVRRVDTDDTVQILLIDATRDDLVECASSAEPERSELAKMLKASGASLVAAAYTFGQDETQPLARIAALARALGAPVIAGAQSSIAGTDSIAATPDPDDWTKGVAPEWNALRASSDARWLSLAAPRFLVRVPYGKRSDECAFPFEEIDGSSDHDAYLWGSPAVLCAVAIGAAVADGDGPPTRASVENMPLYVAGTGVDATTVPCAEAVLSQRAVVEMLDRGLTPLACPRDGDTVLLPRIQSIAMPASPLAIRTEARR